MQNIVILGSFALTKRKKLETFFHNPFRAGRCPAGGLPPNPNLSFSSARRKELKEASTYPKSFPIWKDLNKILQRPQYFLCFGKPGHGLIFLFKNLYHR